jgi:methionyl-tRNA formyltransferase
MKVIFFGTPEFSIPSLEAIVHSHHRVVGVVTAPDKPRGRGQQMLESPLAQKAAVLNLPILKPDKLQDQEFLKALRDWRADLFIVVAFRILPESVFTIPKKGSINLHASLLPKYRGAAPIQRALWNGDTSTGLTTFQIERAVDVGNILKQQKVEILESDDAGSLAEKMALIGANLLLSTLDDLEIGILKPIEQDSTQTTPAPKILPEDCIINWLQPAFKVRNQIRALSPEPGAHTYLDGQQIKIYKAYVSPAGEPSPRGMVSIDNHTICISALSGLLCIRELQMQGKIRMTTEEFLRGYRLRGDYQVENTKRDEPCSCLTPPSS